MKKKKAVDIKFLAGGAVLLLIACNLIFPAARGPVPAAATPTDIPAAPTVSAPVLVPSPTVPPALTSTPAPPTALPNVENIPPARRFQWKEFGPVMDEPIDLTFAPDDSGRIFVAEKDGRIWILKGRERSASPFLNITGRAANLAYEQGLLGLAFHPNYSQNGFFFVNYTNHNGDTVISRFQVSGDPDAADPESEKVLLLVDQPFDNHNGGALAFGPDGFLYIGLGDGGKSNDILGNGQNTYTLLGKVLRIDVDQGEPYAIPPGNAFPQGIGGLPEIWAVGLRNPWRFSFDRQTGDLYIADVGQNTWEEINFLPAGISAGANLGWNYFEGLHAFQGSPPANAYFIQPIHEYHHQEGGCSVTGGQVYRGKKLPGLFGVYLYGDFCSGKIWGLLQHSSGPWNNQLLFSIPGTISSFGQDQAGDIYALTLNGRIYRLERKK
ncbi:MAG: PQQ-dependent sugar dehydrogenase [Anaerolineae bacterium]|nr:PQQ-dependent sugar dehydrogenase [Anaerolineae bacterium]